MIRAASWVAICSGCVAAERLLLGTAASSHLGMHLGRDLGMDQAMLGMDLIPARAMAQAATPHSTSLWILWMVSPRTFARREWPGPPYRLRSTGRGERWLRPAMRMDL